MKYTTLLLSISFIFMSCASAYYYRNASIGKTEDVRAFVEKNPTLINKPNTFGATALIIAVANKKLETAQALIALGADINYEQRDSQTPLRIAISKEDIAMVEILIKAGADVNKANEHGWVPLMSAASRGYIDIVQLLVNSGADVYAETKKKFTASALALQNNHTNTYEYLSSLMTKLLSKEKISENKAEESE